MAVFLSGLGPRGIALHITGAGAETNYETPGRNSRGCRGCVSAVTCDVTTKALWHRCSEIQ